MKYIVDFLENEVEHSHIFTYLKVSVEEAKILKIVLEKYINGLEDVLVFEILSEIYSNKKLDALKKIVIIENLIQHGWLVLSTLNQLKGGSLTSLELFNSSVSLSTTFLKLLEKGDLDLVIPDIKPYDEHLEYLQDEFLKIDLYQQLSNYRLNFEENSPNIKRLQSKLKMLEDSIKLRIEKSEIELPTYEFIKEKELNNKEELIFICLLKAEYIGDDEFRDMNFLLNLISVDELERIKNRIYFEDNSKLISEDIVDYDEVIGMLGGFSKICFINETVLKDLIHPEKKPKARKLKLNTILKEQKIFELLEPKTDINDVVLSPKIEKVINTILKQTDKKVVGLLKEWGIKSKKTVDAKIIFYGVAGTGKTMTALSLAKSMKKPILSFDCSKILSMYIGESEKNVRKIFDDFKDLAHKTKTEPILLLNEADQFLSTRTSSGTSSADKMHNQMQNIFLEQIERFEGILIATTNLLETLDKAFSRRFNYKIKFEKPTKEQRLKLWEKHLPKNAPYENDFDIKKLINFPLTGGQINLIVKNCAYKVAIKDEPLFTIQDFLLEIDSEKKSDFDKETTMGFLN